MNLSTETLNILRNLSSINSNLVINEGSNLATISESKTIMCEANIQEMFPRQIGIYDLGELLSVIGLMADPELVFEENSLLVKSGKQKIRYFYSEVDILTKPSKSISMPNVDVSFTITEEQLGQIRKASSVLRHNELMISNESGELTASVVNSKDPTSNSYMLTLDADQEFDSEFKFFVSIPNLKLMSGDYVVNISSKLISQWINNTTDIKYFIALEKNSSYA